MSDLSL